MIKVYIAGKLNDGVENYIENLSYMLKEAEKVRKLGFSVFVPGMDFLLGVVAGDLKYEDYFINNIEWLKVSDCVYVLDNWHNSNGTKEEIKIAKELGIPVFYNLGDLKKFKEVKK